LEIAKTENYFWIIYKNMFITPNQIRAARGLLDWTVAHLAAQVGVGTTMISAIETGRSKGSLTVLSNIIKVFELAGVEITVDGGVRPLQNRVIIYRGQDDFRRFFDDVYYVASTHENPDICVTSTDEAIYDYWLSDYLDTHVQRILSLHPLKMRVLINENDTNPASEDYCIYRRVPEAEFFDISIYLYGDKSGFVEFFENDVVVTVVENPTVTKALRRLFNFSWEGAILDTELNAPVQITQPTPQSS
jgi:DNA-binding XRE family transcriptional regulator